MAFEAFGLGSALTPRDWAAMRVLTAAVALRELRVGGKGTPGQWMAANEELWRATDRFAEVLGESCHP